MEKQYGACKENIDNNYDSRVGNTSGRHDSHRGLQGQLKRDYWRGPCSWIVCIKAWNCWRWAVVRVGRVVQSTAQPSKLHSSVLGIDPKFILWSHPECRERRERLRQKSGVDRIHQGLRKVGKLIVSGKKEEHIRTCTPVSTCSSLSISCWSRKGDVLIALPQVLTEAKLSPSMINSLLRPVRVRLYVVSGWDSLRVCNTLFITYESCTRLDFILLGAK